MPAKLSAVRMVMSLFTGRKYGNDPQHHISRDDPFPSVLLAVGHIPSLSCGWEQLAYLWAVITFPSQHLNWNAPIRFPPPFYNLKNTSQPQSVPGAILGLLAFSEAMMKSVLLLCFVILVMFSVQGEGRAFPWTCATLNGVCRQGVCLPHELYFGPLGCGKGFLCCVSHFL
ncbi:hypothetical protein ACEWY4_010194 [Coilia grayii]|uniref:Beta-defensin n=1 Tax=Coilia grayii TaxID=363190 RepID=A0ABD1K8J2_9TELE